ncbi:endopeptidase La [Clostridiales bacterium BAD-6]|uniref:Lon protease n=2 Tax=Sinanaerobacter chloroacetimidivorans TaxID=2818044 RepID=A0A8J7VYL1_9FIRM|nr:endopeptidase La [Sinanaerobacter chloroacetimidivorans]MBR0597124.1 endopeptidase La [Sinanaerobacter chloroacetimidivorans]
MPMIPLRGLSIFPYMVLHFDIGREKSISALEKAMMMNQLVFLSAQKDADTDLPTHDDFYKIGTIAKIKQMLKLPGDAIRVLVEGVSRGEIRDVIFEVPYFKCAIKKIAEQEYDELPAKIVALMRSTLGNFETYLDLNPKVSQDIFPSVASIDQPGRLADIITSHLDIKTDEKQRILEAFDPEERLEILNEILSKEIEILTIEQDINIKVRSQINKVQREYYLKEQMRAIQEELGQDGAIEDEIDEWLKQLKKLKLAPKISEKVEKEIKRLSKIQPSSAEGGVIRTYIEWILALPWNKTSKGTIDLKVAQKILDEDHYGLEKVKERVLEYLAVMQLSKSMKAPILCLVGPPGVGKTSVARSIARAVNREFVRMSLGGVRDEAEIRGHRRTYIGAIPGRVISAIKEAGTKNPVFLFDEVDKIGADFRGDPASALLEVLDPEQNKEFGDHYLEIPFDLSQVMFITTANTTDTIPRPLLDRMEVIQVPSYTEEEKVKIAERYLVPKKIKEHGLKDENLTVSETTIRSIINYYTRESGVRNLEREIANVCRKAARKIVEGDATRIRISANNIESYLGKKRYRYDIIEGENEIGVTTGLAWTVVGGDTLFIETTLIPGNGKLVLTGQLGEVMQESAKAGISYIRSISKELGINEDFYKENDLHIHIPEGATPKDGPSAGVTMCTAIISTLTQIPVRKDVAMTGEITLRGKVLPVGGIREKVLAAHRAGIKKVLLPADNAVDIEEIPANVRKKLEFVLINNVSEALEHALMKKVELDDDNH